MTTEPTKSVRVGLKFVRNLENYESLHTNIELEVPFKQNESPDEAIDRVYSKVEEKLIEKSQEATQELLEMDARFRQKFVNRGK